MRTVGLGAEKKEQEDVEELKKTIKSLKASNTKLKTRIEVLEAAEKENQSEMKVESETEKGKE